MVTTSTALLPRLVVKPAFIDQAVRIGAPWWRGPESRPDGPGDVNRWMSEVRVVVAYQDRYSPGIACVRTASVLIFAGGPVRGFAVEWFNFVR